MVRPSPDEAAPYYFTYIDHVGDGDVVHQLGRQLEEMLSFCAGISEEKSLSRYEPGKWSIREVLNHVNDGERAFLFRAFWFARGFDTALPSFDQNVAAGVARADDYAWKNHVDEFEDIRRGTLSFFRNLPADAWDRRGIASGNPFTVRALAYIVAGHVAHHRAVLEQRYLLL